MLHRAAKKCPETCETSASWPAHQRRLLDTRFETAVSQNDGSSYADERIFMARSSVLGSGSSMSSDSSAFRWLR